MSKKSISLAVPKKAEMIDGAVSIVSGATGFLAGRVIDNYLPQHFATNDKMGALKNGLVAIAAVGLSTAITGDDIAANASRKACLGLAVQKVGNVANYFGSTIKETPTNGLGNVMKAFLCENYPVNNSAPSVPGGEALKEALYVFDRPETAPLAGIEEASSLTV